MQVMDLGQEKPERERLRITDFRHPRARYFQR